MSRSLEDLKKIEGNSFAQFCSDILTGEVKEGKKERKKGGKGKKEGRKEKESKEKERREKKGEEGDEINLSISPNAENIDVQPMESENLFDKEVI